MKEFLLYVIITVTFLNVHFMSGMGCIQLSFWAKVQQAFHHFPLIISASLLWKDAQRNSALHSLL
jgi:hypothetical protein